MARRKKPVQANIRYNINYCRKSTEDKEKQIASIDDQKDVGKQCYDNLIEEERSYHLKQVWEEKSAFIPENREVFDEMIAMCNRGEVARIIVHSPSRLARNMQEAGTIAQMLADGRIPEIMTTDGKRYRSEHTNEILMLMIESCFSWKESADKSDIVTERMGKKAAKGRTMNMPPLGYVNKGTEKNKKWIEFDESRAPQMKHLITMAAQTDVNSLSALCKVAEDIGIRTRPTKRNPKGCLLNPSTLQQILRNPYYKGYYNYCGEVYKGQHPALVEVDIWERVQINLANRRTNTRRPKDESLRNLYYMAGVVKCGKCHRNLSFYRAKQKYIHGECKNRKTKCQVSISQKNLMEQFNKRLDLLHLEDGVDQLMREELQQLHEEKSSQMQSERQSLNIEYEKIEAEIGDLFSQRSEAKQMGFLDAVDTRLATLKMRRDELQEALQTLHDEGNDWIDNVIRSFELVKLAKEAIKYGSPAVRESVLKALGSNYSVIDKKLVWEPRSPFREKVAEASCSKWYPRQDSLRLVAALLAQDRLLILTY